jgi:hypothetical protein
LAQGGISVAALVWLAAYLLPPFYVKDHLKAEQVMCLARLEELAAAWRTYLSAHGHHPLEDSWCDGVRPYLKSATAFACPSTGEPARGFAANRNLTGKHGVDASVAPMLVAIFESDAGWNAAGGPELLPPKPRHLGGDNYVLADGHVIWLARKKLGRDARGQPIWAKEPDGDWVKWEP